MNKLALTFILFFSLSSFANADDLTTLRKKKLKIAEEGFNVAMAEVKAGLGFYHRSLAWSKRLLNARLALAKDNKARLTLLTKHVAFLKTIDKDAQSQLARGVLTRGALLEIQFNVIEAEIELAKFKKTLKK